jgi:glycosyltransferase involved in cell wall biosynthesis
VSIVTPSYNQARYLRRTIDSILDQSYQSIELIVIDGGSTDGSLEVLQSYGDRITWISEPDRGQTHAINKGLARAQGGILAYLNSDDVLTPGSVERVVAFFQARPDTQLVYGRAHYIDEFDKITGEYSTEPFSAERLKEVCMICQPATFWRRQVMELVGKFDERRNYAMDYDYWLRAANLGVKFVFVDDYLACSRVHSETKTVSARDKIFKDIFDICWENNKYIGLNYFIGYWHYRIHENSDVIGAVMARIPNAYVAMGRLHYAYISRCHRSKISIARLALFKAVRTLRRLVRANYALNTVATAVGIAKSVEGVMLDNWLSPRLVIRRSWRNPGWIGHLDGTPPVDQHVQVMINGRIDSVWDCLADQPMMIEFRFPAEKVDFIEIQFSNFILDDKGRRVSFFLEATNLFTEADIRA